VLSVGTAAAKTEISAAIIIIIIIIKIADNDIVIKLYMYIPREHVLRGIKIAC